MVAHFNQPPRRAEPGGVSVPPVNCQQDFSSLGKPRRDSKQLDIELSSECLGGALEGSQPAREEWVSEKRTQLFDRDRGSSVNGFQCGDPDPNTLFSRANHNRICGHTEDHSLRRAVHSPAHGVDRNGHPSEGQTHPAVYSSSRIQPSSPQTAKLVATHKPDDRESGYVTEPEAVAPVNMFTPSRNLISVVEAEQLHEEHFYQIPRRDGHQHASSRELASSASTNPGEIIDLTQELFESPVERVRRWDAFRSGVLDLPLLSPTQIITNHFPTATPTTSRLETERDTAEPHPVEDDGGHCHYAHPIVVESGRPTIPKAHEGSPSSFDLLVGNFHLPLESHDRFRRIVNIHDFSRIVVTMHGFISRVRDTILSRRFETLWSPSIPTYEHVDDACLIHSGHDTVSVVLAHAREDAQLTVLSLKDNQVSETLVGSSY